LPVPQTPLQSPLGPPHAGEGTCSAVRATGADASAARVGWVQVGMGGWQHVAILRWGDGPRVRGDDVMTKR
ncbi:MAG: hypothetical protein MI924_31160, partial [Chloroflexales bacterium]|nr:hypothetical protein [Chloroflexales bacterium]